MDELKGVKNADRQNFVEEQVGCVVAWAGSVNWRAGCSRCATSPQELALRASGQAVLWWSVLLLSGLLGELCGTVSPSCQGQVWQLVAPPAELPTVISFFDPAIWPAQVNYHTFIGFIFQQQSISDEPTNSSRGDGDPLGPNNIRSPGH